MRCIVHVNMALIVNKAIQYTYQHTDTIEIKTLENHQEKAETSKCGQKYKQIF